MPLLNLIYLNVPLQHKFPLKHIPEINDIDTASANTSKIVTLELKENVDYGDFPQLQYNHSRMTKTHTVSQYNVHTYSIDNLCIEDFPSYIQPFKDNTNYFIHSITIRCIYITPLKGLYT